MCGRRRTHGGPAVEVTVPAPSAAEALAGHTG